MGIQVEDAKIQVLLLASLVLASALAASSANRNGRPRSGTSRMDSSNLVFRRPNSLIFSYPKGKKSLENILSSPYKRFRSPNSFNFPLLTRMVEEALEGQELLGAMEPEYVDDKEKRDRSFDSVFLGNRG